MNVGEWGVKFRLGVSYDISGYSSLSLVFTKPSGATLTVTDGDGVTAPNSAVSGDDYSYSANEYFEYTTADGDIDEDGQWTVCGIYEDAQKKLVTAPVGFYVGVSC